MENLITILTVCSRPKYLDAIYESILSQKYDNFKWIISFDSESIPLTTFNDERILLLNYKNKTNDVTGYAALNNILDNFIEKDTWICIIDDDNIMYPNYLNTINDAITNELKLIYYKQVYHDNGIRFGTSLKTVKERNVDIAQICFHSSIIEKDRFIQKYTADGIFYRGLLTKVIKDKTKWKILNTPLCYYNYLLNMTKESFLIHLRNLKLIE